jgi:hypothetical protein
MGKEERLEAHRAYQETLAALWRAYSEERAEADRVYFAAKDGARRVYREMKAREKAARL